MSGEVGQPQSTPQPIVNRPGLAKIAYRIGEFAAVRQRLLALLPLALRQTWGRSPLAKLTTRAEDDPAIALLDAWAMVVDVLTFYQERIANEGFLRTATERRSVLELVRATGYELSPGVAASSYLTFTVEEAPGSPDIVTVPQGTQVMSVPVKDELPQTFETSQSFTAYREWNSIRPRLSRPQTITSTTRQLYLAGTSTQLRAGDFLLLVDEQPTIGTYLLPLTEVLPNSQAGYTLVRWSSSVPAIATTLRNPQVYAFRQRAALFGTNAPAFDLMPAEIKLAAIAQAGGAIRGGVVRSNNNGDRWVAASQGLPDDDILCLAVRGTTLYVGTPQKGILRSLDNGDTWETVNEGLTNRNVLALHISAKATAFNEAIFAGTPNGGVFRSKDQGENWVPINTGSVRVESQGENNWQSINTSLPNTVVRCITTYTNQVRRLAGTISSTGTTISGVGTRFREELESESVIIVKGQERAIAQIISNTELTLTDKTAYNARATIEFDLFDITSEIPILISRNSQTIELNQGSITIQGNQVQGENTEFLQLSQFIDNSSSRPDVDNISSSIEISINVWGETKTSTIQKENITSNTSLRIDTPFVRDLASGTLVSANLITSYIFVGTDEGVYRSIDQGKNWQPQNLKQRAVYALCYLQGSIILVGTDTGIFGSGDDGENWDEGGLLERKVFAIAANSDFVFVGTDQGAYRAARSETPLSWNSIHGNNPSLETLKVFSLATYVRGGRTYLVVATNQGLYLSENSTGELDAVTWRSLNQDLAIRDMNAIAVSNTTKTIFAGSLFKGFAAEEPTQAESDAIAPALTQPQSQPPQPLEWPEFRIQDSRQIDLETLYPQILLDSWLVLFDDRDPRNPAQEAPPRIAVRRVNQVVDIQRSAFGLNSKITRIEPDQPINPDDFGLRTTTVFARSEVVPLALEPLTVSDRGFDIFQDPIKPNTIFLSKFIQNLQPQQTLIVRGQHSRLSLDHIGGIYRTQFSWSSRSAGLEAYNVRVLTVINTDLVAGTDVGLYRFSGDNASSSPHVGDRWERLYGLKAEPVYALLRLTARDRSSGQATFWAGTEQGLYRTSDISHGWQRISTLPEDVVLALAVVKVPKRDRSPISALVSGTTLSATNTTNLKVGDLITLLETEAQSRFVTEIVGVDQFKINAAFEPEPDTGGENLASFSMGGTALFVGMRRGLYRSPDHGITWEAVPALENRTITALAAWKTALLAGTEAGVWLSQDTGQTWKLMPLLERAAVRSLRVDRHCLWIGTTSGLYQISNLEAETPQVNWLKGLRDRSILSIAVTRNLRSLHSLIVGTDRGIYRSQDDGQTWIAVDAGLNTDEGRSLHVLQRSLWVGTESGVFQAADLGVRVEAPQWEQRDTGLTNSQVTALAIDSSGTVVMAGVTAGVFRSGDGGRTWKPLSDGLTSPGGSLPLPVQALLAQPQGNNPDRWFATTTAGIFTFDLQSQQWQQVREGLVYTNVRAIALHQNQIYIGTSQGGILRLEETRGSATPPRWQPTGLGNTNIQALVSAENVRLGGNRTTHLLLAGTERDGLFISRDRGTLWQQILESRPGRGTLSSTGAQVIWQGAVSGSHLQPGDSINAAGQTRTIVNLTRTTNNQVEITVSAPFRPDLPENTGFSINTGLTNRNITAIALAKDGTLFVGTAGSGVFRSTDLGDRWQQVITNLDDLEIRCLAVEAVGRSQRVWVGTAHQGVFRSDNGGDLWAAVNTHLTNTDIQAILIPPVNGGGLPPVLVGGIGILTSPDGFYTRPVQRGDIVQVLQPPTQLDISTTQIRGDTVGISSATPTAPPLKLWQILVRTQDGLQGVLQTPTLETLTLLPAAPNDELISEVVTIQEPPTEQQFPRLTLQQPLQYSYDPSTYEILANVVQATHGETVVEVLGSGDGNEANPRFYLKKPPLTYIPAENARGAASTLNLRVDGVLWQEVPSLYPLQPQDQRYIIRIDNEGTPSVTFGDGKRGARLPTGQENIIATYRSGIGLEGNVGPQSLSILKTRPQGISDVTNPLAATGGAGAETLTEARTNAPPTVRTLDRIVSLQDFEDFAQGFAGIGKAEAIALWNGSAPIVQITIAGMKGADVPETSSLYQKLVTAIDQARDPIQQVVVATYERILFNLEGRLLLDPRYDAEVVSAQVQAALMTTFAFERRGFGQPITSAEVIEAMQQIAGITAVDLDALYRFGRSKALESVLMAESARYDPQIRTSYPAQLLLLNPVGVQLTIVSTL